MQFNNLFFYISPQFKAQFPCELLESYCEVEGISFVRELDEKLNALYGVYFTKQQEIKKALKLLQKVKLLLYTNANTYEIESTEKRLKDKKELLFPKKKEKSKKEKN